MAGLARKLSFSFFVGIGCLAGVVVFNSANSEEISFSKEEVAFMKKIQSIESTGGQLKGIVAVAPIILSIGNPADTAINILSTDWELLENSMSSIKTITVCRVKDEIAEYVLVDGGGGSNVDKFWKPLLAKYQDSCKA